jgi:hypothetical protein
MDDLPNIHWRTERNVGLKPMSPRMAIVDVFVLTACCAVGLGFLRWNFGENSLNNDHDGDLGWTVFGMTLLCLFSGLVLGHPVIMAIHYLTGRRIGPLSFGESAGLVPSISTLALLLCAFICELIDQFLPDGFALFVICVLGYILVNLGGGILAMLFAVTLFGNRDLATWTTCLGTAAALVPGTFVLMIVVAGLASL